MSDEPKPARRALLDPKTSHQGYDQAAESKAQPTTRAALPRAGNLRGNAAHVNEQHAQPAQRNDFGAASSSGRIMSETSYAADKAQGYPYPYRVHVDDAMGWGTPALLTGMPMLPPPPPEWAGLPAAMIEASVQRTRGGREGEGRESSFPPTILGGTPAPHATILPPAPPPVPTFGYFAPPPFPVQFADRAPNSVPHSALQHHQLSSVASFPPAPPVPITTTAVGPSYNAGYTWGTFLGSANQKHFAHNSQAQHGMHSYSSLNATSAHPFPYYPPPPNPHPPFQFESGLPFSSAQPHAPQSSFFSSSRTPPSGAKSISNTAHPGYHWNGSAVGTSTVLPSTVDSSHRGGIGGGRGPAGSVDLAKADPLPPPRSLVGPREQASDRRNGTAISFDHKQPNNNNRKITHGHTVLLSRSDFSSQTPSTDREERDSSLGSTSSDSECSACRERQKGHRRKDRLEGKKTGSSESKSGRRRGSSSRNRSKGESLTNKSGKIRESSRRRWGSGPRNVDEDRSETSRSETYDSHDDEFHDAEVRKSGVQQYPQRREQSASLEEVRRMKSLAQEATRGRRAVKSREATAAARAEVAYRSVDVPYRERERETNLDTATTANHSAKEAVTHQRGGGATYLGEARGESGIGLTMLGRDAYDHCHSHSRFMKDTASWASKKEERANNSHRSLPTSRPTTPRGHVSSGNTINAPLLGRAKRLADSGAEGRGRARSITPNARRPSPGLARNKGSVLSAGLNASPRAGAGITVRSLKGDTQTLSDVKNRMMADREQVHVAAAEGMSVVAKSLPPAVADMSLHSLEAFQKASTEELERRMFEATARASHYLEGMDQLLHERAQKSYAAFRKSPEMFLESNMAHRNERTSQSSQGWKETSAKAHQEGDIHAHVRKASSSERKVEDKGRDASLGLSHYTDPSTFPLHFRKRSGMAASTLGWSRVQNGEQKRAAHTVDSIATISGVRSAADSSTTSLREELARLEAQWRRLSELQSAPLSQRKDSYSSASPQENNEGSNHERQRQHSEEQHSYGPQEEPTPLAPPPQVPTDTNKQTEEESSPMARLTSQQRALHEKNHRDHIMMW